jgi:phosphatidylinositol glycan class A protein
MQEASDQRFQKPRDRFYNIGIVCDMFYPNIGGVETHIFYLALSLMELGHKVIVITHQYKDRQGIRYMTNGLKVYYCPLVAMVGPTTFPSVFGMHKLFRKIVIREELDIIHAHQVSNLLINKVHVVHGK